MSEPITELRNILRQLRAPNGCPWDQKQTLDTLKPNLIEESYELIDAIESKDYSKIREELGDVLLQVVFQSQICEEEHQFDLNDVIKEVSDKLIRRHPHVFGDVDVKDADQVLKNWDAIKRQEKGEDKPSSILEGVPRHLPALQKAHQVQKRAARAGFDWPELTGVVEKLEEEIEEVKEAIAEQDESKIIEEMGDMLFSAVNLSRFLGQNPEEVLNQNIAKFTRRFQALENIVHVSGKQFGELSLDEMEAIWQQVKCMERSE
ncbi:nucleoside triphosphate pyrophosphohydrolase [Verrucomicrobiota bacterium]